MVKPIERRSFLKSSAGVVATAAVGTGSAAGLLSRADANDTIRAGVVGLRDGGGLTSRVSPDCPRWKSRRCATWTKTSWPNVPPTWKS